METLKSEKENTRKNKKSARESTSRGQAIFLSLFIAVSGLMAYQGARCSYREYQNKKIVKQKDAVTDAMLIDKKEGVTEQGYAGILFFSTGTSTNQSDAIMHYKTMDPYKIEMVRRFKLGTVQKVSEWKGLFPEKHKQDHVWYDLSRQ